MVCKGKGRYRIEIEIIILLKVKKIFPGTGRRVSPVDATERHHQGSWSEAWSGSEDIQQDQDAANQEKVSAFLKFSDFVGIN